MHSPDLKKNSNDCLSPVIAHRGASAYAPENTIVAFNKAVQLGVKWIECDVMLAACGTPVIFHDEQLDRTTNGHGELSQYPYDYLQTLDAGSWFDFKFANERIPTLAQALEFIKNNHMAVNLELKPYPGHEQYFVHQVLTVTKKYFPLSAPHILFSSFSLTVLQDLRQECKDCHIGFLLHEWEPNWQQDCLALQCVSVHLNEQILTPQSAKQIKEMNKKLLCYTINECNRAKELYSWGVDAVFSDVPDQIVAAISQS